MHCPCIWACSINLHLPYLHINMITFPVSLTALLQEQSNTYGPVRGIFLYPSNVYVMSNSSHGSAGFLFWYTGTPSTSILLFMLIWRTLCTFSSTWVSGLYYQEHPEAKISGNWAEGTRAGSFALLIYAIVAMVAGFVFPWLTSRRYLSMKNVYTGSHLIYGVTMLSSYWIRSVVGATAVIGLVGISWACSMWIPYAFVGAYLYNENNNKDTSNDTNNPSPSAADDDRQETKSTSSSISVTEKSEVPPNDSGTVTIEIKSSETLSEPAKSELENTGMALGVVNIFVVLPQFLVALIAALIFMIRQKYITQAVSSDGAAIPTGDNDVVGVTWVLEFGSWMAFVAALLSRRVIEVWWCSR